MDAQTQSTDLYIKTVEWLHVRRKPLLIAAVAVAVIALAWGIMSWKKAKDDADANDQFFAIPLENPMRLTQSPPAPLLEVAREYPSTPAGEHAQALAAEMLFTQAKYPEAYQQFSDFISNHPDSALVPEAKLGVAACLEAEGKASEAITKYRELIFTYPTEGSIVSPAKLTLARLYEAANQPQQALDYYTELARMLQQNPQDLWGFEARERAQLLLAKHPELLKNLNSPSPGSGAAGFTLDQPTLPATGAAPKRPAAEAPAASPNSKLLTIPGGSSNATANPK
jgi:tetratricopeptide (TPR) repeat protein